MCLITYAPKGANTLNWTTLKYSYTRMNGDGFGISWFNYETGLWEVWRSMRSHRLDAAVDKIPQDVPLVIHQRFATHGSKTMVNCHPFEVGETGAFLFHNGTIKGTRADYYPTTKNSKHEDISDTRAYIEDELAPMLGAIGAHLLLDGRMKESIGSRIRGSVLAVTLPGDPAPVLVNEHLGDWEDGLYYSNTYSRPYTSKYDDAYWHKQAYGSYGWEWEEEPKKSSSRLIGFRGYGTADANDESPERAAKALDEAEKFCDLHFERDNRPYSSEENDEHLTPQERYNRLTIEEQEWAEWYAEQEDIDDETAEYLEAQYGIPVKRKVA